MALQRIASSLVLASCLMHVLCCGLPLLLSLGSLGALLGQGGVGVLAHEWFEPYELPIMIASGLVLMGAACAYTLSRRIDCRTDGACMHAPCDDKKDMAKHVLCASAALYAVNLVVFLAH